MNFKLYQLLIAALLFVFSTKVHAQSATAFTSIYVGPGGAAETADSLYLGPGLFELDGNWEIYSEYVLIDPNATFTGTGTLMFMNPGLVTGTSASTKIDANNLTAAMDINIDLQNDASLVLTNLSFPADFISTFGWAESSNATLYAGKDLNFGTDGAHLVLGSTAVGDLRLDADATLSGYRPARHIVSNNSILSHVVKEAYTSAFIFPVGIAAGDYTPAQISNASANTVSVSVQDYVASASPEALTDGVINAADGMNRSWHIFAGTAGISSNVNLQHNSATNQTGFVDAAHFITQWGSTTPNTTGDFTVAYSTSAWQTNAQGPGATGNLSTTGTLAGSTMRNRTYASGLATSAAANESYFSKSTDMEHPLPIELLSFEAKDQNCTVDLSWKTGSESKLKNMVLQHSVDGIQYKDIFNVDAKGMDNSTYSYKHTNAPTGNNYYRMVMYDKALEFNYSATKVLQLDCAKVLPLVVKIYPNPTTSQLFVEGMDYKEPYTINLTSIEGKVVLEKEFNTGKAQIDMEQLPQAQYVLKVIRGKNVELVHKITKY